MTVSGPLNWSTAVDKHANSSLVFVLWLCLVFAVRSFVHVRVTVMVYTGCTSIFK